MNSQKGIVGCLLLACTLQMPAQVKTYKYRVNFRDKAETTYTLDNPSAYLSERALERRMRQRLPVDSTDLPVCQSYIDMLVGKEYVLYPKVSGTIQWWCRYPTHRLLIKWRHCLLWQLSGKCGQLPTVSLPAMPTVKKR